MAKPEILIKPEVQRVIIQCITCNRLNVATAEPAMVNEAIEKLSDTSHRGHEFQVEDNFDWNRDLAGTEYYADQVEKHGGVYVYLSTR